MFVYYDESLLSPIASLRNHYGLSSSYPSDRNFDIILKERSPQRIVMILVDALGFEALQSLDDEAFLKTHLFRKYQTVLPSATGAAYYAIMSGLSPNMSGYLGGLLYLKDRDDYLMTLRNTDLEGHKYPAEYLKDHWPIKTLDEELKEKGLKVESFLPDFHSDDESFHAFLEKIIDHQEADFIFAYWNQYDRLSHLYGPADQKVKDYLQIINDELAALAKGLNDDTLLVILADHGMVEVRDFENLHTSPLKEYLVRRPVLEDRLMAFYIKADQKEAFEKTFKMLYEDDYILLNEEQVIQSRLFGYHENHKDFNDLIGDYVAIAKGHKVLYYREDDRPYPYKGQHGGIKDEELYIPLIIK